LFAIKKKLPVSDIQIATTQEKRNALMCQIKKWRDLQLVYMPGIITSPLWGPEDNTEDDNAVTAETEPLHLPSSLDPEQRKANHLQQVTEHEQLLRMAQLQDSLIELRHTRKIRRKLLMNHYMQVAGQGQRANTRSRTVLNSVENRIAKFVERYRTAYQALCQLDPSGDWREVYLVLKDSDNRGPGKERDEEGTGDGTYLRSWIWLSNPQVRDVVDGEVGEEGASEEDVNEVVRVEWTTSFARLERWTEEVELLHEEMRRVVMFLEWKLWDWLARIGARGEGLAPDVQSGLDAYAKKQVAVYHDLAVTFAKFWRPTLVSYGLQHSWITEYMTTHEVPLTDTNVPISQARGIFKHRLSKSCRNAGSTTAAKPSKLPVAGVTIGDDLLGGGNCSDDNGLEDIDSGSEDDWDDDWDL